MNTLNFLAETSAKSVDSSTKMSPTLFITIFFVYVIAMILFSIYISKKQTSGEDFLLGNRSVPFFLILGTTVATMVGTGSSMGAVGLGYKNGWIGSMYGIGGALGILLLAKLFVSVRKYNFMTMSEEVSFYYGANKYIKGCIAILILFCCIGWLGAHILGGSFYLSYVGKMSLETAKVYIALAFGIYVIIGGYMAVVWTDTIQAVILFAGFILMAFMAISEVGGFSEFIKIPAVTDSSFITDPSKIIPSISMAFVIMVGVLATPSYRQRIYSSDSEKNAAQSFYLSGALYLFFSFIPALIGMCAFHLTKDSTLSNHNHAFPYLASEVLPVWIGLVVLIAGISATMSSAINPTS